MTQFKITLRGSVENGEGHISQGDINRFTELCNENPILAADLAQDWAGMAEMLYEQARDAMRERYTSKTAKTAGEAEGPIQ